MNIQQMMKQAQTLQKKMSDMQNQLETVEVMGVAGGGLVKITATAKGVFKNIKIDPSLLVKEEVDMLEDLILAALLDTKRKADSAVNDVMGSMGVPPDMMKMMS